MEGLKSYSLKEEINYCKHILYTSLPVQNVMLLWMKLCENTSQYRVNELLLKGIVNMITLLLSMRLALLGFCVNEVLVFGHREIDKKYK